MTSIHRVLPLAGLIVATSAPLWSALATAAPQAAPETAPNAVDGQADGEIVEDVGVAEVVDVAAPIVLRAPMLRDGAMIIDATGTLERTPGQTLLSFRIDRGSTPGSAAPGSGAPQQVLTLLPTRLLEEMESLLISDDAPRLQVTGIVTLYGYTNYLMPLHVSRLGGHSARTAPTAVPRSADQDATADPADGDQGDGSTASTADAGLATAAAGPPTADPGPATTAAGPEDDSIAAIVAQLQGAAGELQRGLNPEATVPLDAGDFEEGVTIIGRRGHLTRDRHGAWVFVFDADVTGGSEPPATILPCAVLASLRDARSVLAHDDALLISGQVHAYRGRHFLLPSRWRPVEETPNLSN